MESAQTVNEYIMDKFKVSDRETMPIKLPIGRFKDVPRLFDELGFKVGAEVGVYQGDYSRWLFKMIPGLKLYGIDLWETYPGYKDFRKTDLVDSYERAKKNVEGYDSHLIKAWSADAVKQFEDESLDFVFIDGNHAYEWVVQDIALWSKKVKPGGIIYGHDYDDYSNSKRWREMTVIPAVDGWMKAYKISPWYLITKNKNTCWLYVKN